MKSFVEIKLLKVGAMLTIGEKDSVENTWAVSDEELLMLLDRLTAHKDIIENRVKEINNDHQKT